MGDNGPLRPDLEPSGGWPEHPDEDQVQGPSAVTQAWAAEADARLAVTKEWAEGALRAGAERRLAVAEAGALAELERRNLVEALDKMRKDRDEWRERALDAEAILEEKGWL